MGDGRTTPLIEGHDEGDRGALDHAQMEVIDHLLCSGHSLGLRQASALTISLTDPAIRHHVQTILDLTPTRQG